MAPFLSDSQLDCTLRCCRAVMAGFLRSEDGSRHTFQLPSSTEARRHHVMLQPRQTRRGCGSCAVSCWGRRAPSAAQRQHHHQQQERRWQRRMDQANSMSAVAQPEAAAAAILQQRHSGQGRRQAGSQQCWASTSGSCCARRCCDVCTMCAGATWAPFAWRTLMHCHMLHMQCWGIAVGSLYPRHD